MPPNLDAASPVPLDERGFIAADVPCLGCAYDLRGLTPTGNCPECNAPIASSVSGDVLRLAPVEWLRDLRAGLLLLIIATAGVPALFIVCFRLFPFDECTQACLIALGLLVFAGIGAAGVFRATACGTAESATPIAESPTRRLARCAAVANVAVASIFVAVEFFAGAGRWPNHTVQWTCLSLLTGTFGVASVTVLLHLTTLLRRTRSVGLARAVACSALGFGTSTGLVACGGALAVCFGLSESNIPGTCARGIGALLGAVSFVAGFVVLVLSHRAVAAELRSAAAWQRAEPPIQSEHPRHER